MSCVFQNRARLLDRDAGEPVDELNDRRAALQVFEQRRDLHARAFEDKGPADAIRIALDSRA